MTEPIARASQGHRYRMAAGILKGKEVICVQGGDQPRVCVITDFQPWPLMRSVAVSVADLEPQPMRYFHGEVPR